MMAKKKKGFFDRHESGLKRAGSLLGSGLDWYMGADRKKNKAGTVGVRAPQYNRGSYSEWLVSGKKPKPIETEEEKKKQEIHIHIHS